MSNLGELLTLHSSNGVEYRELGNLVDILDNFRKPVSRDKREAGEIPYYGANGIQGYVKDHIFEGTYLLMGEDGSVINPDRSPVLNWVSGKIWVNNHAHVLSERPQIALLRYVYYALQLTDISKVVRGMPPKINQANMRAIRLPVPSLEVQHEIVKILDKFTDLERELEAEFDARRLQLEKYRDDAMAKLDDSNSTFMPLKECAGIFDGTHQTPAYTTEGIKFVSVENIDSLAMSTKFISQIDYERLYKTKPRKGDLLMTRIGSVGRCAVIEIDEPLAYYVSLALIKPQKELVSSSFIKHFLESHSGRLELDKRTLHHAVPLKINLGDLNKVMIRIPDLETQDRLTNFFDKLEEFLYSKSAGIGSELKFRRSQHDYFQEKLLGFKALEVG